MMRLFPDLFAEHRIAPVENYPEELLATLKSVAPRLRARRSDGRAPDARALQQRLLRALLPRRQARHRAGRGPRPARRDNIVFMRTTEGPKRVDVLYRRARRRFPRSPHLPPGSSSACPGLMNAYRAGNITLANAVGTGVADDKAVYSYMPEIVRFYLGEEPILKNVPTWRCREKRCLRLCARASRRAGGEGGRRLGRLRHAGRPGGRPGDARALRRRSSGPIRRTTSPSRRSRSPPRRPSSAPASRPATSTCAPSSFPAPTRSASSPAASPASR